VLNMSHTNITGDGLSLLGCDITELYLRGCNQECISKATKLFGVTEEEPIVIWHRNCEGSKGGKRKRKTRGKKTKRKTRKLIRH